MRTNATGWINVTFALKNAKFNLSSQTVLCYLSNVII